MFRENNNNCQYRRQTIAYVVAVYIIDTHIYLSRQIFKFDCTHVTVYLKILLKGAPSSEGYKTIRTYLI